METQHIIGLVDLHGTAVYRFCFKLTGNRADADDLYQETFLKAFQLRGKIREEDNPCSFLLSVCLKLWKSSRRKYARRQKIAPLVPLEAAVEVSESGVEETVVLASELARVRAAADALEEKYRVPVYLHYTLELDIGQIARVMSIPPGTVKSRLHKARAQMRKRLEDETDEMPKLGGATV